MEEAGRDGEGLAVAHNAAERRFEAHGEGRLAIMEYELSGGVMAIVHTEVPGELRGRGIADGMAHAALEHARDNRLGVVPLCPFVAGYIRRHPEYRSLVVGQAASRTERSPT